MVIAGRPRPAREPPDRDGDALPDDALLFLEREGYEQLSVSERDLRACAASQVRPRVTPTPASARSGCAPAPCV